MVTPTTPSNESETSRLLENEEPDNLGSRKCSKDLTPIKWRSMLVLFFLNSSQPMIFELIFPFINQMIYEIGVVDDPEKVGFYSGVIESCFALTSFLAIMPATYVSNRFGRRPVILFGITGLGLSMISFALSRSFSLMVISRCIGGTLGGSSSAVRTMIGEMTDKSNQGTAFTGLAISYRTGQIVGQPLGGLLAHPERSWRIFNSPFWLKYPFALPCFVGAGFSLLSVSLGYFFLNETLPAKRRRRKIKGHYGTTNGSVDSNETERQAAVSKTHPTLRSVLTKDVISVLVATFSMSFLLTALFAVYPLFAFTPIASGGLGLKEATIGAHLAIRSLLSLAVMLSFPALQRRLGTVRTHQIAMCFGPLMGVIPPVMNLFVRNSGESTLILNGTLCLYFVFWSFLGVSYASVTLLSNDVAPSAEAIATLAGAAQMAIVLPQTLAPTFVTSLFAYSIQSKVLGGNFVWAVLGLLGTVFMLQSFTLKEPSHDWREEYCEEVEGEE